MADQPERAALTEALTAIAVRGVELQPAAERVLTDLLGERHTATSLARQSWHLARAYWELRGGIPPGATRTPRGDRLERLLNYHQQILEQARVFAFGPYTPQRRAQLIAHYSGRFGGPAQDLRELLAELQAADRATDTALHVAAVTAAGRGLGDPGSGAGR